MGNASLPKLRSLFGDPVALSYRGSALFAREFTSSPQQLPPEDRRESVISSLSPTMRQTRSATGPLPEIDHDAAIQSMRRPRVRQRKMITEQKHTWKSNGQIFSLFSLPPEIRQMIYRELLIIGDVDLSWQTRYRWSKGAVRAVPVKSISLAAISRVTGILLACRQAYEEARRIIYGENSFTVRYGVDTMLSFLDRIGHANRMVITSINLQGVTVDEDHWPNFCALASTMPLRSLNLSSTYNLTSLKSSADATWVKDLARIGSLKKLSLSFSSGERPVSYQICPGIGLQHQLAQEFLDYLTKEFKWAKGKVLHQEHSQGTRGPYTFLQGPYLPTTETFVMDSTPKFTLELKYYLTDKYEETDT
ncbi:hypothetical protein GP486_006431 [Trichoglossum hirsutum]|uniref:F-box domain-containing protein n=1 Tax=Trichoglossum hirsutum TaxID=265104 RepID=A0A9P8IHA4_9PEZI|nr:hypothetical protein GP486_006431 [Trichoglossum hirsutum]